MIHRLCLIVLMMAKTVALLSSDDDDDEKNHKDDVFSNKSVTTSENKSVKIYDPNVSKMSL